ncbi:hypothetical protein CLAFUW4_11061 [Fulvia fulva]|uniref:Uncharacterized protein n=1 Tax=Passalora fulva TaxID=5499 RepID=A0A9Q8URS1_PASFU|nr:uncharacterized protein CLAFUR5_10103 [Fulvia fulva]KAK4619325.1 hypothetical protein CLAFUR4_11066 [Fulvia fulva]KAK4620711.1 hypothetical protein CLAFUR0_11072 [Fulvia fulva]UJO20033.1 hypothetical protein CLAFUR5_10103 [Fulvia fulva]WPV17518.1 hypothetical protein CLAFUW4_11061 [Fulvia fulva]WPV32367.1 hypothetical protein CLAFUW7_11058 [Fulvia fulva]
MESPIQQPKAPCLSSLRTSSAMSALPQSATDPGTPQPFSTFDAIRNAVQERLRLQDQDCALIAEALCTLAEGYVEEAQRSQEKDERITLATRAISAVLLARLCAQDVGDFGSLASDTLGLASSILTAYACPAAEVKRVLMEWYVKEGDERVTEDIMKLLPANAKTAAVEEVGNEPEVAGEAVQDHGPRHGLLALLLIIACAMMMLRMV